MTRALKWRIAIGLLLVFLAGAATGTFAGAWHARSSFKVRHHGGMMGERMREHMARHLDLTPEQIRTVDPILDRAAAELHQIRTETGRRVAETMRRSHQEIAPHLTPEQQAKLEKMKGRHMRILKFRGRRHGPPPPHP
jgi:Spy/CpxP family protein refolding chaperone